MMRLFLGSFASSQNSDIPLFVLHRRKDTNPNKFSRICSCHFPDGDSSKSPIMYERNAGRMFSLIFQSPEKKKRLRRRKCPAESCETSEESRCENTSLSVSSLTSEFQDELPMINVGTITPTSTACTDASQFPDELPTIDVSTIAPTSTLCTDAMKTSVSVQTEHIFSPEFYEADIYFKNKEIEKLQEEIRRLTIQPFGFFQIKRNEDCLHYTGLCIEMFNVIKDVTSRVQLQYYKNSPVQRVLYEDQLLLAMMKLRLNCTYYDLGKRFGISKWSICNILFAFLPVLHKVVYQAPMKKLPSREKCKRSLPSSFKDLFESCRVIIDCTEMRCEIPSDLKEQKMTFSSYKHFNTVKFLFGVAPNATAVYCSNAYPGCTSDKEITKHCKDLLEQLEAGDLILADKGFLVHDILPDGVSVNLPPFLLTPQFRNGEVEETRNIARARIHIERLNARVKRYKITQLIPKVFFSKISLIVQICVGLTNFQKPLLKCMNSDFYLNEKEGREFVDDWAL